MTTFYCDFENGNDANDGTTFANRWKSLTSGATAARIAPGDEIRIMGSPAPTSLGQNGVWTSEALQATKTISSIYGNETPIRVTTSSAHSFSTGDTVYISNSSATAGNGTWEITVTDATTFTLDGSIGVGNVAGGGGVRLRNNTRVMLTTAVTQNIASTGPEATQWTASANVTTSLSTANKEHYQSDSIAIAAGFTTGLAAYWATPSTLDLSGYQQVSFWIRQTSGTIGAAGAVDLRLCSDNAGVTAVNTISIPALGALNRWMPVTVDLGTNLGSSIQSIALYVNTDNGAQTFLLSNIIACKASSDPDSLTLTSLIGKNTSGETFWGIQSINGRRVMLDADTNAGPSSATLRGYYGTSETVTTYKRETIKLGPTANSTTALQTIQDSGTDGSPITFSGGWDRTDMSTQTLETWLDGVNGNGRAIATGSTSYNTILKIAGVRFNTFLYGLSGSFYTIDIPAVCNNTGGTASPAIDWANSGSNCIVTLKSAAANNCVYELTGNDHTLIIDGKVVSSASNVMLLPSGCVSAKVIGLTDGSGFFNNAFSVLSITSGKVFVQNITTNDNGLTSLVSLTQDVYCLSCFFGDSSEVGVNPLGSPAVYSHDHDQTAGNHKIFLSGGLISAATDQRHTASGISWKIQPTNTSRTSSWPVTLSLAKVACAANSLVTIKAWMRRTNTSLTMRLVCKGGQIAGVTSDVVSAMTAAADTWEELTITFTPTEVGVVEITAEAWGGTTYSGWVDDLTISQA